MKVLSYIAVIVFCLPASASFSQNQSKMLAQTGDLAPVYRWFQPGDKDWITLRDGEIDDRTLDSWGYRDKTYSFSCSVRSFTNSVALYRWFHPGDKDWITITENEISTTQMQQWGYQDKTPSRCFGSRTRVNNGVAVYRWFHPTDKDWITLADGEIPEAQLESWGYQDKTFQFYAWR
jgi:hypothetical protein